MKPIRALPLLMLLPLLPVLWSAIATDAAPKADASPRAEPLFLPVAAELPKPLAGLPSSSDANADEVPPVPTHAGCATEKEQQPKGGPS